MADENRGSDDLIQSEKEALILALAEIACADEVICDEERNLLSLVARRIGVEQDYVSTALESQAGRSKLSDLLQHVERKWVSRYILRDCALMAVSDNELHPKEKVALQRVRLGLGLSQEYQDQILQWAKDGIAWQEKGEQLVADVNSESVSGVGDGER